MSKFEKIGVVSIWAGFEHQESNVDLLKDLCGVEFYDVDYQECIPAPFKELALVENLVSQFSYSESFADNVCSSARNMEVIEVAWLVMQLDFSFDPQQSSKEISKTVKFLGTFEYEDDD